MISMVPYTAGTGRSVDNPSMPVADGRNAVQGRSSRRGCLHRIHNVDNHSIDVVMGGFTSLRIYFAGDKTRHGNRPVEHNLRRLSAVIPWITWVIRTQYVE